MTGCLGPGVLSTGWSNLVPHGIHQFFLHLHENTNIQNTKYKYTTGKHIYHGNPSYPPHSYPPRNKALLRAY